MTENISLIQTRTFEIINIRGLHARASHKFVQTVEQFDAKVEVTKDGMSVGGDEIMELLLLAASMGCTIDVSAEGNDAEQVLSALDVLISNKFGEGE
jgi:phosphocarrier protein HPr